LTNFLEEVSHRTGVYKGSAQEQKRDTSNNKVFIADNSLNRLLCLRWTSKTQRKEILPAHNETPSVAVDVNNPDRS